MRPSAVLPAVLSAAALVLSFLCLFAGHKKSFMQNFDILTLNTSRIGTNLLNESARPFDGDNPITSFLNNVTSSVSDDINEAVGSLAERLGMQDFYSAHVLDYCWGTYEPGPVPNATLHSDDIDRNVSACSNRTAMFYFNPTEALERSLNESGVDVTLTELHWPDAIQDGINSLRIAARAVFVLYCIAICLCFLALVGSLLGLFASGRLAAAVNIMVSTLAFLALGVVSAIATAVIVKGSNVINKNGREIGVEAERGNKFMALTWAATGAMFIAVLIWCVSCIVGHRSARRSYTGKAG